MPKAIYPWITFITSLILYWVTADPGVSYWDCPEYVVTASLLEIGHPPGNPIWMLAMRVATIPFPPEYHAYVINLCSGLLMSFASFFLCKVIYIPVREYLYGKVLKNGDRKVAADLCAGLVSVGGSLCFSFCDSAWYSAVEAEVYAMSAFLSALSLWIMMCWWHEENRARRQRLIILLAYITGLSLGVHQLNLLLIPVFALIIIYRKHPERISPVKVLLWLAGSCILIGVIIAGFMPGLLFGASQFELFSVNTLGFPYHSGVIIFICLLFAIVIAALIIIWRINPRLTVPLWTFIFLLIGFSSFGVIMTRAGSYPAMNEGMPDNIFSLTAYIQRDQYPSSPLIYGATPYSRPLFIEDTTAGVPRYTHYILEKGKPRHVVVEPGAVLNHRSRMLTTEDSLSNENILRKGHGYLLADYDFKQKLTPELDMWFPRITSGKVSDRRAYEDWAGMNETTMRRVPISETMTADGLYATRMDARGNRPEVYSYKPTYLQHIRYFIAYQAYYMYFRYLFWNFIGRQNDFPSSGEIEHGNFITGFKFIDSPLLGDTDQMPYEIWEGNKGRNRYYGIPFAFGLAGIIFMMIAGRKSRRLLTLITVLFVMTGLAIVVYLNQDPGEPRERDYTFLVSYMAFSMWIAAAFAGIAGVALRYLKKSVTIAIISIVALSPCALMAVENFDDHDRRGRFETEFFATSLLEFEEPAIIFTHGDNSTFPVWYASEVRGKGKDHIPVDVTYLSLPSYVINLKQQGNRGISTLATSPQLAYGAFVLSEIPADTMPLLPLTEALRKLYNSEGATPKFPASRILLPASNGDSVSIDLKKFTRGSKFLTFKHLMLLDIIASQLESEKPKVIYFPAQIGHSFYSPLDTLLLPALFGKIYAPYLSQSEAGELLRRSVDRELTRISEKFKTEKVLDAHYSDPVIEDHTKRYRGEMTMAAHSLFDLGDTTASRAVADTLWKYFPYHSLLPGDFTVEDTTYYEGKDYGRLLQRLYEATGENRWIEKSDTLDSIISRRHDEWLRYYYSLSPEHRKFLSNRSHRLLIR